MMGHTDYCDGPVILSDVVNGRRDGILENFRGDLGANYREGSCRCELLERSGLFFATHRPCGLRQSNEGDEVTGVKFQTARRVVTGCH